MASSDLYDRRSESVDVGRDAKSWSCWRGDDEGGEEGEKGEEGEGGGSSDSERVWCSACIIGLFGLYAIATFMRDCKERER